MLLGFAVLGEEWGCTSILFCMFYGETHCCSMILAPQVPKCFKKALNKWEKKVLAVAAKDHSGASSD